MINKILKFQLAFVSQSEEVATIAFLNNAVQKATIKNKIKLKYKSNEGSIFNVKDGTNIFVYEYLPKTNFKNTIYIVSGITGINHKSERDIIEKLSNNENRIVVLHPRGTGYSGGNRGDAANLKKFIDDYLEIICLDKFYCDKTRKIILYGHSMSCAIAVIIGNKLPRTDGIILVNPSYKLKRAKGMTPKFGEYLKYALYYIFAPHIPIVNISGNPSLIQNSEDRKESEIRNSDPLIVKYFSVNYMLESKKIMDSIIKNAQQADYPLLLLYGENDMIVDIKGCEELFNNWKCQQKRFEIIKGGSHGKSTVIKGITIILKLLKEL